MGGATCWATRRRFQRSEGNNSERTASSAGRPRQWYSTCDWQRQLRVCQRISTSGLGRNQKGWVRASRERMWMTGLQVSAAAASAGEKYRTGFESNNRFARKSTPQIACPTAKYLACHSIRESKKTRAGRGSSPAHATYQAFPAYAPCELPGCCR